MRNIIDDVEVGKPAPKISDVNVVELIDFHTEAKLEYLEKEITDLSLSLVKLIQEKTRLEAHLVISKAIKGVKNE